MLHLLLRRVHNGLLIVTRTGALQLRFIIRMRRNGRVTSHLMRWLLSRVLILMLLVNHLVLLMLRVVLWLATIESL